MEQTSAIICSLWGCKIETLELALDQDVYLNVQNARFIQLSPHGPISELPHSPRIVIAVPFLPRPLCYTGSSYGLSLKWYTIPSHSYRAPYLTTTQPPKRRGAPASSSAAPKRARPSKLAKENNISAEEETEIKEVFHLFAEKNEDFPAEKDGVIPREDVRKALVYVLGHHPAQFHIEFLPVAAR